MCEPAPGLENTPQRRVGPESNERNFLFLIYAVGLLVLACTGIFILPGKKGLGGRGRWLLIVGLSIPIVYLVIVVWR